MTDLVTSANHLRAQILPVNRQGVFEGYASVFKTVDGGGDMVLPGAFAASIAQRKPSGIRMLFQHDPSQPIGVWQTIREDAHGLFVRGKLTLEVSRANELAGLLAEGAIDGLSIGFKTISARHDRLQGVRKISKVDLWEISLVTFPMLASARVTSFKSYRAHCAYPPGSKMPAGNLAR